MTPVSAKFHLRAAHRPKSGPIGNCETRGQLLTWHRARLAQEDVYLQSAALQDDLSELFRALDKGKGTETGFVPKVRFSIPIEPVIRVFKGRIWLGAAPAHCSPGAYVCTSVQAGRNA